MKKNKINKFIDICKMSQSELKLWLSSELKRWYSEEDIIIEEGYIYARGELPILITAHLDTVHKESVKTVVLEKHDGKTIVSSPQGIGGDDRCGVYAILQILHTHKPTILFCEDEEIGGKGSSKFTHNLKLMSEVSKLKYCIELDRANAKDLVFYDCDNPEFTTYLKTNTDYKSNWGSFSDISNICPEAGVAGVNLSCGYYNAHKTTEYVVMEELENTIKTVRKLLDNVPEEQFEYIESFESRYYNYGRYGLGCGYGRDYYFDSKTYTFIFYENGSYNTDSITADSEIEALGEFMINHPNVCFNDIEHMEISNEGMW